MLSDNDLVLIAGSALAGVLFASWVMSTVESDTGLHGERREDDGAERTDEADDADDAPGMIGICSVLAALSLLKWTPLEFHWVPVVMTVILTVICYCTIRYFTRKELVSRNAAKQNDAESASTRAKVVSDYLRVDTPDLPGDAPAMEQRLTQVFAVSARNQERLALVEARIGTNRATVSFMCMIAVLVFALFMGPIESNSISSVIANILWPFGALLLGMMLSAGATDVMLFRHRSSTWSDLSKPVLAAIALGWGAILLAGNPIEMIYTIAMTCFIVALVFTGIFATTRLMWLKSVASPGDAEALFIVDLAEAYRRCCRFEPVNSMQTDKKMWDELESVAESAATLLPRIVDGFDTVERRPRRLIRARAQRISESFRSHQQLLFMSDSDMVNDIRISLAHGLVHACNQDWGKLLLAPESVRTRTRLRSWLPMLLVAATAVAVAIGAQYGDALISAENQDRLTITMLLVAALSVVNRLGAGTTGVQDLTARFLAPRE